jgi:hypothetical protein
LFCFVFSDADPSGGGMADLNPQPQSIAALETTTPEPVRKEELVMSTKKNHPFLLPVHHTGALVQRF